MKLAVIVLSTAVVIASAPAVFAQGVSSKTPGHEMQKSTERKLATVLQTTLRAIGCRPTDRKRAIRELSVTRLLRF